MSDSDSFKKTFETLQSLRGVLNEVVVGQHSVVDQILIGLAASGHLLLEGVPGLAKTLLARCIAHACQAESVRIQFTPDLMPSDIVGHAMFDNTTLAFTVRQGPVFTNVVVADEINRAPAKTQSALLEAMQEYQVSIEGESRELPSPFWVVATQNPIEQEGTYPLPQAQLDRFLCKILIDYPTADDELRMLQVLTDERVANELDIDRFASVCTLDDIVLMQRSAASVRVDPEIQRYIVAVAQATRDWNGLQGGAGPRGTLSLLRAARGQALLQQREFVMPDDVKNIAVAVLRHRVRLSPDLEIEGYHPDNVIRDILDSVEAPRQ